MEAIFDRSGRTVGWRKRDVIHDLTGAARAFVRARALFSRDGAYLGRVEDQLYRDTRGRVVAFERGATGGPLLPTPQQQPVPPVPELRPLEPRFADAPPAPTRSLSWSDLGWLDLLAGADTPAESRSR